jgi:hypothetical protein
MRFQPIYCFAIALPLLHACSVIARTLLHACSVIAIYLYRQAILSKYCGLQANRKKAQSNNQEVFLLDEDLPGPFTPFIAAHCYLHAQSLPDIAGHCRMQARTLRTLPYGNPFLICPVFQTPD